MLILGLDLIIIREMGLVLEFKSDITSVYRFGIPIRYTEIKYCIYKTFGLIYTFNILKSSAKQHSKSNCLISIKFF